MKRQEGYYWVKYNMHNMIALWAGNGIYPVWRLSGISNVFSDSDFSEINETRIPAPDEKANINTVGEQIAGLLLNRISFTFDGAKNEIKYNAPGKVKISGITVTAGFDFQDTSTPIKRS